MAIASKEVPDIAQTLPAGTWAILTARVHDARGACIGADNLLPGGRLSLTAELDVHGPEPIVEDVLIQTAAPTVQRTALCSNQGTGGVAPDMMDPMAPTQRNEMTQGKEDQEEFAYSEAAMEQWRASKRRAIRPALVFLPFMVVAVIVHSYEVAAVALTLVGMVAALAMTGQNLIIGRRAERRMKTEKKEWEAKQP